MIRQWAPVLWLLVATSMACASPRRPAPAAPEGSIGSISPLVTAVAFSREKLDSAVLEIHRISGDTSRSALAQSRQLRKGAAALDSAYRSSVAEFLATFSALTSSVPRGSTSFPIEKPPAPFVRAFADGSNWMLQSPLIHEMGKNGEYIVIVPRGFVTDFASIPKPLRILKDILPTTDRYGIPALVHDYLYWRQDCTREQADNIMEIALKEAGVSLVERKILREGIRQFGQSSWDGNRNARRMGMIRTVGSPHDQVPLSGTWPEYREWLRAVAAKPAVEYRVPETVCAIADSNDD
jgi:hypothetical protein